MCGKLGDFLHAMLAVKCLSHHHNSKANVFLYDIGWEHGIETTFTELSPILLEQDYIQSVSILTEYELDPIQTPVQNTPIRVFNKKILTEGYIDLGSYIRSPWLFKTCWTELYSRTFGFDIPDDYKWITYNHIDERFVNKVIIHRRYNPVRLNHDFPYKQIMEEYKGNLVFAAVSENDYEKFPYKDGIPFIKLNTLHEMFTAVNSCEIVVSNLTGFAAVAHAMDKVRIIELPEIGHDAIHCMGEEKYSQNVFWYLNGQVHN